MSLMRIEKEMELKNHLYKSILQKGINKFFIKEKFTVDKVILNLELKRCSGLEIT